MIVFGLVFVILLTAVPAHVQAQELNRSTELERPDLSPKVRTLLERDPRALQFRRAWKPRVEHVMARRAELEARQTGPLLASELQQAGAAVTGELAVPVALGLYSDATAPYPTADYQERLLGDVPGVYSARTVYREMSRGMFEMGGTVHGWYDLPQAAGYYEPSDSTDDRFGRTGEYLRDVLDVMDGDVDFTQYDNDGPDGIPNSGDDDGYVDVVTFVYPNWAASCGGPGIWPHRWVYQGWWGAPYSTNDVGEDGTAIRVDDYTIQAGLACDQVSLMTIGTFAHEMGHALALPDLYDTDHTDGESEGVGHWDLMASGNWNRQESPGHMGAWSKEFLGWLNVSTVTDAQFATTLAPVYDNGDVLRYDIPDTREYFLLEHRQPTGSDQHLHGPGLLIWHIDQDVIDAGIFSNSVNADESHKGVDVEEADGNNHLDGGGNRGDAGDPFPGTSGTTEFSSGTRPGSRSNDGVRSGMLLRNIVLDGGVLTFDLITGVVDVALTKSAAAIVRGDPQSVTLDFDVADYPHLVESGSGTIVVDADVLRVDSVTPGSFGGTVTSDLANQTVDGTLTWSVENATPPTDDTFSMITLWVSAVTEDGAVGDMEVVFDQLTDSTGGDMLPYLETQVLLSAAAASGIWGDVDYTWRLEANAGPVSARDALICLNAVVEKDMSAFDTVACDVMPDAGTDYDGTITALDALTLLKAVVGLDTSDSRVDTPRTP